MVPPVFKTGERCTAALAGSIPVRLRGVWYSVASLTVVGSGGQDTAMGQFTSYDGTKLAFRRAGAGRPLVCLPGGPGRTPDYLGDLGGLGAARELILPDTRGTGEGGSALPRLGTHRTA